MIFSSFQLYHLRLLVNLFIRSELADLNLLGEIGAISDLSHKAQILTHFISVEVPDIDALQMQGKFWNLSSQTFRLFLLLFHSFLMAVFNMSIE